MKKKVRIEAITIHRENDIMDDREGAFIGIYAGAQVSYPIGRGDRRLEWLKSGGLWGIESPVDEDGEKYCQEVENDALKDLEDHLKVFGVDVSNFWKIARNKED
jgi:hypothetical protein